MTDKLKISNEKGFVFTHDNRVNPVGKNNLTSRAASFQRTLYHEAIYPCDGTVEKPLDTLYENKLYGRVDRDNNVVVLKSWSLTTILGAKLPLFAPTFLGSAFRDFRKHMARAYMDGAVSKDGNPTLLTPTPTRGFVDPTQQFNQYHNELAYNFVVTPGKSFENPIDGFQTFIQRYASYLKTVAEYAPVTKTNFMLSSRQDPMSTGLCIAISNDDASKDAVKYNKFIKDPNFGYYTKVAKRYGFLVDKNKPWTLCADLFSSAMLFYLRSHLEPITYEEVTKNNFFDVYYNKTYLSDFNNLSQILIDAYKFFAGSSPLYQTTKIDDASGLTYTNASREAASPSLLGEIDPFFLMNLYIDLRQIESLNAYSPAHVNQIRIKARQAYHFTVPTWGSTSVFSGTGRSLQRAAFIVNYAYKKLVGCTRCHALRKGPELGDLIFSQMWISNQLDISQNSKKAGAHQRARKDLAIAQLPSRLDRGALVDQQILTYQEAKTQPVAQRGNAATAAAKQEEYTARRIQKESRDIMGGHRTTWRARTAKESALLKIGDNPPGYERQLFLDRLSAYQDGRLADELDPSTGNPLGDPVNLGEEDYQEAMHRVHHEVPGGILNSTPDQWPADIQEQYAQAINYMQFIRNWRIGNHQPYPDLNWPAWPEQYSFGLPFLDP